MLNAAVPGAEELDRRLKKVFRPPSDDLICDAPNALAPAAPPVFEIARLEAILSLQQAAFDQLFKDLDEMEGGFLARVKRIVSRHSGKYYKERPPCG